MVTHDGEVITKAEHLAQVLIGTGTSTMKADARAVLARVPVFTLAEMDAMAAMAHKSRNAMLIHLLDVGLEEVRKQLPDDKAQTLNEQTTQLLFKMVGDTSEQTQVEE